jgi:hypothetical protein
MPPALLALGLFEEGLTVYAQAGRDHDLLIYASYIARMTGLNHCAPLLLVEVGTQTFCLELVLNQVFLPPK